MPEKGTIPDWNSWLSDFESAAKSHAKKRDAASRELLLLHAKYFVQMRVIETSARAREIASAALDSALGSREKTSVSRQFVHSIVSGIPMELDAASKKLLNVLSTGEGHELVLALHLRGFSQCEIAHVQGLAVREVNALLKRAKTIHGAASRKFKATATSPALSKRLESMAPRIKFRGSTMLLDGDEFRLTPTAAVIVKELLASDHALAHDELFPGAPSEVSAALIIPRISKELSEAGLCIASVNSIDPLLGKSTKYEMRFSHSE